MPTYVLRRLLALGPVMLVVATVAFVPLHLAPGDPASVIKQAPRLVLAPIVAIMATILGLHLFGDGLRDALDPKLRSVTEGARSAA